MKELKSIKLRLCISILIFLTTLIIYTSGDVTEDERTKKKILADFPTTKDFNQYFNALNKAVDFFVRYKNYVDLNLQFGLFLVNMNLGTILQQDRKKMSNETRSKLGNLLGKIDNLSEFFRSMVENPQNDTTLVKKKLALLFYISWPEPPEAFHTEMLNRKGFLNPEQMATIYGTWEDYHYYVYNAKDEIPTPAEIDACLTQLVLNSPFGLDSISQANCVLSPHCKQKMVVGNESRYFGYALTHRLLLLIVARFALNCAVFTETTDRDNTDMYCNMCFNEAEYIAYNRFQMPDLIFEQVALCSIFGHAQFIRKSWLQTLLGFQTSQGCFSEKLATGNFEANKMREDKKTTWNLEGPDDIFGECHAHFSGVAMASLSNGLRYIIENYY